MLVDFEPPLNHYVHIFGSLVLDSVSGTRKKIIARKDVQIKALSGSEATVISQELYKEVFRKFSNL